MAVVIAVPAEGPSFGTAPSGQCICIPCNFVFSNSLTS